MLSEISKELQDILKPQFKALGFRKNGRSWGHSSGELAKLFNIQCSQYGKSIYFNIGVYFQETGRVDFPKEINCHMRFRLEQLLDKEEDILHFYELTKFTLYSDVDGKVNEIVNLISDKVFPFFSQVNTVSDVLDSEIVQPNMFWLKGREIAVNLCSRKT